MKEALLRLGLSEQEASIYSSLARRKSLSATHLAKETGINRSVVYGILESLKEKGLVSEILINGIKQFSNTRPEALLNYIKYKEEAAHQAIVSLQKIEKDEKGGVKVEVYQGVQGGLAVLRDIIAVGKDYAAFGEDKPFQELFGTLAEQYVRQLKEKKIKERLIGPSGQKISTSKYSEIRYLPKDIKLPTISVIYGDKVAFAIFQKPYYSIVIESRDLAVSYQSLFEYLWKIAKP